MTILASGTFVGADANPLPAPWTQSSSFGAIKRISNAAAVAAASVDSWMWYSGPTYPNDQYAKATVSVLGGFDCGVFVRHDGAGSGYYITQAGGATHIDLYKVTGGSFSLLNSFSVTPVAGDVFELRVTGASPAALQLWVNGAQIGATINDASSPFTSGVPGIGFFDGTSRMSAFEFGDFGAGGGPTITGTSTATPADGASLTITGTAFGAAQGLGGATIGGTNVAETSWADTSIAVTTALGLNKYGVTLDVVVTDNALAASAPFAITSVQPVSGWSFVDIVTPNANPALRVTGTPVDLGAGDQVRYNNQGGLVTIVDDGTLSWSPGVLSTTYAIWRSVFGYGSDATITLAAPQNGPPSYPMFGGMFGAGSFGMVFGIVPASGGASFTFSASGGLTFAGAATASEANNYSTTGSGGLQFGGTAGVTFASNYTFSAAGGATFGGAATASEANDYAFSAAGGLAFGGTAAALLDVGFAHTASGGLVFAGTATQALAQNYAFTPAGGVVFSGAAAVVEANDYAATSAGGVQFGGAATTLVDAGFVHTASGGLQFGGNAALEASYTFTASGGLVFGGAALTEFNVAGAIAGPGAAWLRRRRRRR